ncbi:sodium:solute symporter family protein, partial [Anaerosalibacter bizertensis]|nr:sodium:solute symporter family protein [Anaerosalibacter bizertensis]
TGINVEIGTLISAIIIIFLSVVGGLVSVAYTDAVGTLIIFIAMIIGLPIAVKQAGGLSGMISAIPAEQLSVTGKLSGVQLLGYTLPTIFLVLGEQNLYQRFGSAKDVEESRKSGIGLFWLGLLLDILILGLVTPAIVLYPNLENPDTAFFQVAMGLPEIIGAFMLASSVALFITTADSYLLSAGTNVTYDFWARFINKDASDKEKLIVTRVSIVVLGIIALVVGKFFPSILSMQMYAYSIYGAAVTPAFLACLFWDKATKAGGLTSIIVGGLTVLIWEIVLKNPMGLNSIVIAGPLSIICLIIVSLMTQSSLKKSQVNE